MAPKKCTFGDKSDKSCKGKTVSKQYDYCIKHMMHQKPLVELLVPDECPVCFGDNEDLKQYCCGHWVHKQCIIDSGKAKCPICRQFIYVDKDTLQQIRNTAVRKDLETQVPLMVVFDINVENPQKPFNVRYGMNKLYTHNTVQIDKLLGIIKQHLTHYMFDLDTSLLLRCLFGIFRHDYDGQVQTTMEHVDTLYSKVASTIMECIVKDIKDDTTLEYFPVEIDSHVDLYLGPGNRAAHSITFMCKIKDTFKQEGTPDFGYIHLRGSLPP